MVTRLALKTCSGCCAQTSNNPSIQLLRHSRDQDAKESHHRKPAVPVLCLRGLCQKKFVSWSDGTICWPPWNQESLGAVGPGVTGYRGTRGHWVPWTHGPLGIGCTTGNCYLLLKRHLTCAQVASLSPMVHKFHHQHDKSDVPSSLVAKRLWLQKWRCTQAGSVQCV